MIKLPAWLAGHASMEAAPLMVMVVLSYMICRQTAIHVSHQTDVVRKKPSEHYEDLCVLMLMVYSVASMHPSLRSWPALVTLPVASAIFAWISNLPDLQSSLNAPSSLLLLVLGVVVVLLIGSIGYLGYTERGHLSSIAVVLVAALTYIVSLYLAAKDDAREGYKTQVHLHHWQIGLVIAVALGYFTSMPGIVLAAIGLAVIVHGNSVYRLTSPFCGWRVPCSATKYSDVPSVPLN